MEKTKKILNSKFLILDSFRGFTLIELLVVISIIGVILAISIFAMGNARKTSRDTRRKADLEQMRSALELYKSDCKAYPMTDEIPAVGSPLGKCDEPDVRYLEEWPADPLPQNIYGYSSDGVTYTLCASLEGDSSDGTGCPSCDADPLADPEVLCRYKVTNP